MNRLSSCYANTYSADMALKRGEEFAAAANCSTLACLEALPLPDLLRASRDVSAPVRAFALSLLLHTQRLDTD